MQHAFLKIVRIVAMAIVCLMSMSPEAQACTCFGTGGIGTALTEADSVVLGVVKGRRPLEPEADRDAIEPLADVLEVRVLKTLAGSADDDILISTDIFCYSSFDLEDFEFGQTYVFPVWRTESNGVFTLPGCSHSALMLADGRLYTREMTRDFSHRLEPYMNLTLLELLLPTGMLSTRSQMLVSGGLALLLSLLLTARYRKRKRVIASFEVSPGPFGALRSLTLRTGAAAFTMLLGASASVYAGLSLVDWVPWVLSALFALAAAGIVLRWTWSEGLGYGLMIIIVGICSAYLYDYLQWFHWQDSGPDATFAIIHSVALSIIALMVWCALTVRRRFDQLDGQEAQPAAQ